MATQLDALFVEIFFKRRLQSLARGFNFVFPEHEVAQERRSES